jgi:hypothetical protein
MAKSHKIKNAMYFLFVIISLSNEFIINLIYFIKSTNNIQINKILSVLYYPI